MKKVLLGIGLALSLNGYSQEPVKTQAEITQSISAAFDSVTLIKQLNALPAPLSVENSATKSRNVDHLKVMMAKMWFFEGLTTAQKTEINALII